MSSSRTTELLLEDIVQSADKILMYTRGMNYYEFATDDKTVDAVVRNIEIIGEAAAKIPGDFKETHPEIDWQHLSHFVDNIVLDTSIINYEEAWKIREEEASELLNQASLIAKQKRALRPNSQY